MGDRDEPRATPADLARAPLRSVQGCGQGASGPDQPTVLGGLEELCLPALTSSARVARHWVMNQLAAEGVFGAENQVIELLTGELVANAAVHGPQDGRVLVRAWRAGDKIRVAVRDESSLEPVVQCPEPSSLRGRGLALVATLAADWGIERHGTAGKTVWFSVTLDWR